MSTINSFTYFTTNFNASCDPNLNAIWFSSVTSHNNLASKIYPYINSHLYCYCRYITWRRKICHLHQSSDSPHFSSPSCDIKLPQHLERRAFHYHRKAKSQKFWKLQIRTSPFVHRLLSAGFGTQCCKTPSHLYIPLKKKR